MNDEIKALVDYRLQRAKETLQDANLLFENGKLPSAVNRIYYAMFYAVNALLLTKSLSSAKHSGVLSLFQREFVKTGIVEDELGQFYAAMSERRQKSDYRDFVKFQEDDVRTWLEKADKFNQSIEEVIRQMLQDT